MAPPPHAFQYIYRAFASTFTLSKVGKFVAEWYLKVSLNKAFCNNGNILAQMKVFKTYSTLCRSWPFAGIV